MPNDGCTQTGSGGVHTDGYYEGGSCAWCGAEQEWDHVWPEEWEDGGEA